MKTLSNRVTYLKANEVLFTKNNVRTVSVKEAEDKALMQSIKTRGVIQNISVYEKDGKHYVIAGARRLASCKALQKTKELPNNFELPAIIVDEKNAVVTSLAENIVRAPMHFADEFIAFSKMIAEGSSIKSVATEYNMTQKEVKQRLALSNVHHKIITCYKNNEIDLETVMAFTLCEDKDKQVEYIKAQKGYINAHSVRAYFENGGVALSSNLVLFVGIEAYNKAGGTVISDLFNDSSFLTNRKLLNELCDKKLNVIKQKYLDDGWKWVETTLSPWGFDTHYCSIEKDDSKVPKKLLNELEKHKNLALSLEDGVDWQALPHEEVEALELKMDNNDKKIDELHEQIETFLFNSDAQKAVSGVQIRISNEGKVLIDEGMQRPEDIEKIEIEDKNVEDKNESEEVISQALSNELTLFANQLTQLELIQNPEIASVLYQFEICYKELSGVSCYDFNKLFCSNEDYIVSDASFIQDSKAFESLNLAISKIDKSWIKPNYEASFIAFSKLTASKRAIIFGSVVSSFAKNCSIGKPEESLHRELRTRTKFNRAEYWKPTKNNYFGRLKRSFCEVIANKFLGEEWVDSRKNLKNKQFAEQITGVFNGEVEPTEKSVKKDLLNWLPEQLK